MLANPNKFLISGELIGPSAQETAAGGAEKEAVMKCVF